MGYASIEEITKEVKEWSFINELPEELYGFKKETPYTMDKIDGQVLNICIYSNLEMNAEVKIIYSTETFDYILVRREGLNEFRDLRFIFKERSVFETKIVDRFDTIMKKMAARDEFKHDILLEGSNILEWEYGKTLPKKIGEFELYANPNSIIEHTNGSVIFLDYSDFKRNDQFGLHYNKLRNDYFAEIKIAGVSKTIRDFDCKNMEEMDALVKLKLVDYLNMMTNSDHTI